MPAASDAAGMASKPRISFIVPCLNEEKNIEATVKEVLSIAPRYFSEIELVLVNDGSKDRTGEVIDRLAKNDPRIKALHNPKNRGMGGGYKTGLAGATLDYVMLVPGDNAHPAHGLAEVFEGIGYADILVPYPLNPEARSLVRRFISRTYVVLLNTLFGLDVPYYNGLVVHRRKELLEITIKTDSFAYQAETLLKMLKRGLTYSVIGTTIDERRVGRSSAFRFKNIVKVIATIIRVFFEVGRRGPRPRRIEIVKRAEAGAT